MLLKLRHFHLSFLWVCKIRNRAIVTIRSLAMLEDNNIILSFSWFTQTENEYHTRVAGLLFP